MRRSMVSLLVLVALLSACRNRQEVNVFTSPTGPTPPASVLTSIDYTPAGATLKVGESVTAQAVCRDQNAMEMPCPDLTWTTTNDSRVSVTPGGVITCHAVGSAEIRVSTPNGGPSKGYAFNCVAQSGPVTPPGPEAPELVFSATPSTIEKGESSLLEWMAEDADICFASGGWSGDKPLSGSQLVSPSATTTYSLTCEGVGSVSESVTVVVTEGGSGPPPPPPPPAAPVCSITANPTSIQQGGTSTLTWDSSISVVRLDKSWTSNTSLAGSSQVVLAETRTFTVTCFNSVGQTSSDSVTVTVTGPSCPSTIDYSPKGGTIGVGQKVELTVDNWPSNTSCDPFWYTDSPSRLKVIGADKIVYINNQPYFAGERAFLEGIFQGQGNVLVQTSIVIPEVLKSYLWNVATTLFQMPERAQPLQEPRYTLKTHPDVCQTYPSCR